jgi:hypothetical protein
MRPFDKVAISGAGPISCTLRDADKSTPGRNVGKVSLFTEPEFFSWLSGRDRRGGRSMRVDAH